MKTEEIYNLTPQERDQKLVEMKKELFELRCQLQTGRRVENPGKIPYIRRDIARILTIERQKNEHTKR